MVEKDLDGLTPTLALYDDPNTPVALTAGEIMEFYRSRPDLPGPFPGDLGFSVALSEPSA